MQFELEYFLVPQGKSTSLLFLFTSFSKGMDIQHTDQSMFHSRTNGPVREGYLHNANISCNMNECMYFCNLASVWYYDFLYSSKMKNDSWKC